MFSVEQITLFDVVFGTHIPRNSLAHKLRAISPTCALVARICLSDWCLYYEFKCLPLGCAESGIVINRDDMPQVIATVTCIDISTAEHGTLLLTRRSLSARHDVKADESGLSIQSHC